MSVPSPADNSKNTAVPAPASTPVSTLAAPAPAPALAPASTAADNSKRSAERAGEHSAERAGEHSAERAQGHSAERAEDRKARLLASLAADLAAETADLLPLLSRLGEADWDAATPAAGWTIRDQVTHLAFFDDAALLSLRDRGAFLAQAAELRALGDRFPDLVAEQHRHLPGGYCLEWLASSRASLVAAFRAADPAALLPWYGVQFSVASAITGRLMETWAHGQDIADTIGVTRQPTARLRHIASLGIRALPFSFMSRGLGVPPVPVVVELTGPSGEAWTSASGSPGEDWTEGLADAENRVTGDALDFCLVVTQRRNVADTGLRVDGPVATQWVSVAQAFAGPPTDPRPPAGEPARSHS